MCKREKHLFACSGGVLYDTRDELWSARRPLRPVYSRTFFRIDNTHQLRATLRAGQYAWPGGYQLYFLTSDGGVLSFEAVRQELASVTASIRHRLSDGWRVIGTRVNYDEPDLRCDHTGKPIPPAYGDE